MQSQALKAVGSLTIREGKAHSGLDESCRMRRVELYLAWACETKGARPGGANTLVTVWLWVLDDGVAVVGFI